MERIAKYGPLKKRAKESAGFVKQKIQTFNPKKYKNVLGQEVSPKEQLNDLTKIYTNLDKCAEYLVFHDYYTIDQLRLVKAHTCKQHLLCPFCARRRAAKATEKAIPKIETLLSENPHLIPVMITLTVKNGPDLKERYDHLKNAYRRLQDRRRDFFKKGVGRTEFRKIQGAMASYEVTNKGKGWHPHIHMFALIDSYIDQKALSREWHEVTGDSKVVGITRIRPSNSPEIPGVMDITTGILEVLKYAVKFQDLSLEDTWHAFQTLRGKRLLDSFGCLRGIKEPEKVLDDPLEGLPYLELFYRYDGNGNYDLKQVRKSDEIQAERRPSFEVSGEGSHPIPQAVGQLLDNYRYPSESNLFGALYGGVNGLENARFLPPE